MMLDLQRCKQVRKDAIFLSKNNGGYHYGGSFSCVEILVSLYDHILGDYDKFILSKGHGCWAYYVLLQELGYKPLLEGHPHYDPSNGIYCTTGSMGHGLPVGIGMALAKKIKGESGSIFVLMGDGECQEGTTWESFLIAGKLNLKNLNIIIDSNGIQGSGFVADILPVVEVVMVTAAKAGWNVYEIDGHENDLIDLASTLNQSDSPNLVVANTVKGKGVSFMEGEPKWHSKPLGPELVEKAMEELA